MKNNVRFDLWPGINKTVVKVWCRTAAAAATLNAITSRTRRTSEPVRVCVRDNLYRSGARPLPTRPSVTPYVLCSEIPVRYGALVRPPYIKNYFSSSVNGSWTVVEKKRLGRRARSKQSKIIITLRSAKTARRRQNFDIVRLYNQFVSDMDTKILVGK